MITITDLKDVQYCLNKGDERSINLAKQLINAMIITMEIRNGS